MTMVSERIRQHRLASGPQARPSLSRAIRADGMWLHLRGLADSLRARSDEEAADAIAVFEPTGTSSKITWLRRSRRRWPALGALRRRLGRGWSADCRRLGFRRAQLASVFKSKPKRFLRSDVAV